MEALTGLHMDFMRRTRARREWYRKYQYHRVQRGTMPYWPKLSPREIMELQLPDNWTAGRSLFQGLGFPDHAVLPRETAIFGRCCNECTPARYKVIRVDNLGKCVGCGRQIGPAPPDGQFAVLWWAFLHNCIAHPLLFLTWNSAWAVRLHDWSSERMHDRFPKLYIRNPARGELWN